VINNNSWILKGVLINFRKPLYLFFGGEGGLTPQSPLVVVMTSSHFIRTQNVLKYSLKKLSTSFNTKYVEKHKHYACDNIIIKVWIPTDTIYSTYINI